MTLRSSASTRFSVSVSRSTSRFSVITVGSIDAPRPEAGLQVGCHGHSRGGKANAPSNYADSRRTLPRRIRQFGTYDLGAGREALGGVAWGTHGRSDSF